MFFSVGLAFVTERLGHFGVEGVGPPPRRGAWKAASWVQALNTTALENFQVEAARINLDSPLPSSHEIPHIQRTGCWPTRAKRKSGTHC
jgi:hypothetical protein